jgi:hypothetical protein
MASFFSAAKTVLKQTTTAALNSQVGKTIRSTIDSHKVLDVRAGKWKDPGRKVVKEKEKSAHSAAAELAAAAAAAATTDVSTMQKDNKETKNKSNNATIKSTHSSRSDEGEPKDEIDLSAAAATDKAREKEFSDWFSKAKPVGSVSVEIHGLRDADEEKRSTSAEKSKKIRRGTKYYAVIFLEGSSHTTGKLKNLNAMESIPSLVGDDGKEVKSEDIQLVDGDESNVSATTSALNSKDLVGHHQCSLDVRDVTSDVFVQVWSTRGRIGHDVSRSKTRGHEFIGQSVIPIRHLCPHSLLSTGGSVTTKKLTLRLWPLDPDDVKLQSGIPKLKGSAMTRPSFASEQQTNIDITISLSLLNTLPHALVENPPYPLSHGHEDSLTQHMIDIYYLKKGILRAKAIFQTKPKWITLLYDLRSWENPLMSSIFMLFVVSLWWRKTSIIWLPLVFSVTFSAASFTTYISYGSTKQKRYKKKRQKEQENEVTVSETKHVEKEEEEDNDTDKEEERALYQLGVTGPPIVWEENVGVDPDNMIAKMKHIHHLISSASHPLNKYSSKLERLLNSFSWEDPMITLMLNIVVLGTGVVVSVVAWCCSLLGWNNVMLLGFLLFMTPPNFFKQLTEINDNNNNDKQKSKTSLFDRLIWLYMRVPDSDEIVHRKMAKNQIVD